MAGRDDLDAFHYPTDLLTLLVDTIAHLCRGREDVLTFFRGCGVPPNLYADLRRRLGANEAIPKAVMAREVLAAANEAGPSLLAARREIIRRVLQTGDFPACWAER